MKKKIALFFPQFFRQSHMEKHKHKHAIITSANASKTVSNIVFTNQGTIKSKVKEVKQKVTTFSTDFTKLDFRAKIFLFFEGI